MVSSSKILTVSYGTFSCTAEGFDDPLEVVKETTHFFRGVVGEDRFFGAEPPQFDPELASEYLRDRMADTGGTLSLGSPPRVMAAAASAGAMAAAMSGSPVHAQPTDDLLPDDDTIEATAVLTESLAPDVPDLDPEAVLDDLMPDGAEAAPAPPASAPDDIAAKLDRIRAVVASTVDDDAEEDVTPVDLLVDEDSVEEALVEDVITDEDVIAHPPLPDDGLHAEPAFDDVAADDPPVEAAEDDTFDMDDSLESLLGEISGGTDDPDTAERTDTIDLDDDTDDLDEPDNALDAAVASLLASDGDAPHEAPASAMPLATATATAAIAALTGVMARDDADETPELDTPESDDLAQDQDDDDSTIEAVEAMLGRNWAAEGPLAPAIAPKTEKAAAPAEDPTPASAPVHARVIKVKRAAFEQAIDDGMLEEVQDTPAPPPAPQSESSSLSPEEELELARELAAVKAELASDFGAWDDDDETPDTPVVQPTATDADELSLESAPHDAPLRLDNPISAPDAAHSDAHTADWDEEAEDAMQDSARKAVKLASPARAMLTEREVKDDDTSRLLDQTNSEMDEPEGNRRRSAIAHLRAAVAATKADRLLAQKPDADDEQEPYREDLASVVRPRRPQSVAHNVERPQAISETPTPLKLVAEQRVVTAEDTAPAADGGPVRPRRVRRVAPITPAPTLEGDESGFAAFAEDVGVKDLPELLEAAAAYMSYVEGRDQFSRPQLMTTLRQAEVTDSSREDRLRSFGQLLREGKIRKTSGGRFTAAETISFKPAATG